MSEAGRVSRREFLAASLLAPALARLQPPADAHLVGTLPFATQNSRSTPLNRKLGDGYDARLFSDLSALSADALATPTDRFFLRTAASPKLPPVESWTVTLGGLVKQPATLDIRSLDALRQPTGQVLIECAGNSDPANFGLMSVADWDGVRVLPLLERILPTASRYRILVSGFDDETAPTRTSIRGASWIFTRDDLQRAFLGARMNGTPLTPDHGAPVRLVVPGWYGCACIKWVNRIDLVPDDAPRTSQMAEYAGRTHQDAEPDLARDYTPAIIDTAATPVRIEKWARAGKVFYRVVGIIWGGSAPTDALAIRFKPSEPWVKVEHCPLPSSTLTWSLWTHTWTPSEPGRYSIVLKVTDPTIRTRRLDLFYYVRDVVIEAT
ncbi:MAG TPA: molybdopterin-dependent oxidoreductase [Vicinamibacterales bacterium]|jgi:DMSO/TMAO reductase YedYZ molybdopterin-dependent catalytic subunit